jgi:hypothetical protein
LCYQHFLAPAALTHELPEEYGNNEYRMLSSFVALDADDVTLIAQQSNRRSQGFTAKETDCQRNVFTQILSHLSIQCGNQSFELYSQSIRISLSVDKIPHTISLPQVTRNNISQVTFDIS